MQLCLTFGAGPSWLKGGDGVRDCELMSPGGESRRRRTAILPKLDDRFRCPFKSFLSVLRPEWPSGNNCLCLRKKGGVSVGQKAGCTRMPRSFSFGG